MFLFESKVDNNTFYDQSSARRKLHWNILKIYTLIILLIMKSKRDITGKKNDCRCCHSNQLITENFWRGSGFYAMDTTIDKKKTIVRKFARLTRGTINRVTIETRCRNVRILIRRRDVFSRRNLFRRIEIAVPFFFFLLLLFIQIVFIIVGTAFKTILPSYRSFLSDYHIRPSFERVKRGFHDFFYGGDEGEEHHIFTFYRVWTKNFTGAGFCIV